MSVLEFSWNGSDWITCGSCGKPSVAYIPESYIPVLLILGFPNYQSVGGRTIYLMPHRVIFNLNDAERAEIVACGLGQEVSWEEAKKYNGYLA